MTVRTSVHDIDAASIRVRGMPTYFMVTFNDYDSDAKVELYVEREHAVRFAEALDTAAMQIRAAVQAALPHSTEEASNVRS